MKEPRIKQRWRGLYKYLAVGLQEIVHGSDPSILKVKQQTTLTGRDTVDIN